MIITGNLIIKQILNALVLEGEDFNNYVKSQMDFIDTDDLLDTIPIIMNHKSFDIQYLANNDSLNEKILLEAYKDTTKRNMYYKMYGTFGNIRLLDNEIKILEEIMLIRNIDFKKGDIKNEIK